MLLQPQTHNLPCWHCTHIRSQGWALPLTHTRTLRDSKRHAGKLLWLPLLLTGLSPFRSPFWPIFQPTADVQRDFADVGVLRLAHSSGSDSGLDLELNRHTNWNICSGRSASGDCAASAHLCAACACVRACVFDQGCHIYIGHISSCTFTHFNYYAPLHSFAQPFFVWFYFASNVYLKFFPNSAVFPFCAALTKVATRKTLAIRAISLTRRPACGLFLYRIFRRSIFHVSNI